MLAERSEKWKEYKAWLNEQNMPEVKMDIHDIAKYMEFHK